MGKHNCFGWLISHANWFRGSQTLICHVGQSSQWILLIVVLLLLVISCDYIFFIVRHSDMTSFVNKTQQLCWLYLSSVGFLLTGLRFFVFFTCYDNFCIAGLHLSSDGIFDLTIFGFFNFKTIWVGWIFYSVPQLVGFLLQFFLPSYLLCVRNCFMTDHL